MINMSKAFRQFAGCIPCIYLAFTCSCTPET